MTAGVAVSPEDLLAPDPEDSPCGPLDDLLIALLIDRTRRARDHQAVRTGAGLPARRMDWEYAMVRRYTSRLGPHGAEIARVVLTLANSGTDLTAPT